MPRNYYERNEGENRSVKCVIKNHLMTLRDNPGGWTREVNIVSWEDMPSKLDIREWNKDKTKSSKGLTFTRPEVERLRDILNIVNLNLIEETSDRRYRGESKQKQVNVNTPPIAEYIQFTGDSSEIAQQDVPQQNQIQESSENEFVAEEKEAV